MPTWINEALFEILLTQSIGKASEGQLQRLSEVAIEDEPLCYKSVVAMLDKASRRVSGEDRSLLHILFILSEILRRSRKAHGDKSRYGEESIPLGVPR